MRACCHYPAHRWDILVRARHETYAGNGRIVELHDTLRAVAYAALRTPSPLQRYQHREQRRKDYAAFTLFADDSGEDNYAVVLDLVSPPHFFAQATAFFGADTSYSITVDAGIATELTQTLADNGWRLDEEESALVLPRLPAAFPPPPPELTIRVVTDAAGFAAFQAISRTPPEYIPSLAAATDPAVALLVGYRTDTPVASSRLSCLGTIADVMGVTTDPDYRRRGYGTAMTWAAIAEGARRGCTVASLTATEMGYTVYTRMGFQPVCIFHTYLPPP